MATLAESFLAGRPRTGLVPRWKQHRAWPEGGLPADLDDLEASDGEEQPDVKQEEAAEQVPPPWLLPARAGSWLGVAADWVGARRWTPTRPSLAAGMRSSAPRRSWRPRSGIRASWRCAACAAGCCVQRSHCSSCAEPCGCSAGPAGSATLGNRAGTAVPAGLGRPAAGCCSGPSLTGPRGAECGEVAGGRGVGQRAVHARLGGPHLPPAGGLQPAGSGH